jgi:hypothetical protein
MIADRCPFNTVMIEFDNHSKYFSPSRASLNTFSSSMISLDPFYKITFIWYDVLIRNLKLKICRECLIYNRDDFMYQIRDDRKNYKTSIYSIVAFCSIRCMASFDFQRERSKIVTYFD